MAFACVLAWPGAAGAAISCTFTSATHSVYANVSGNGQVVILKRSGAAIAFNNVPCAGATVSNTATIRIGGSGQDQQFFLDLSAGPLAPGSLAAKTPGDRPEIKLVTDLAAGTPVTILGGAGNDHISAGKAGVQLDGDKDVDLKLSGAKLVKLDGAAGNDWLFVNGGAGLGAPPTNAVRIIGGVGNDTLYGGSGNDRIEDGPGSDGVSGGDGNDLFISGGGVDAFSGNGGDDTLRGAAAFDGTTDDFYGGDGDDKLDYSRRTKAVCVTPASEDICIHERSEIHPHFVERIIGGAGNDFIEVPDDTSHQLSGGLGPDILFVLPHSSFEASPSNVLDGGAGNDQECGATGDDVYFEGDAPNGGDDFGSVNVSVGPSSQYNICADFEGHDTVDYSGRTGNLEVFMDALQNDGEAGEHDNVHSLIGVVIGGSGSDTFIGNDLSNTFFGGAGNDYLNGGKGQDLLHGGEGDDYYFARDGYQDSIFTGPGTDAVLDIDVGLDLVQFGP